MKYPVGNAPPRRLAKPKKPVQLNLRQRRPAPEPDDEISTKKKSAFWKWVALVAFLHVVVFGFVYWFYQAMPTPPPPPEFEFSLLPAGDVVKGSPGVQQAPKIGHTTPAPSSHHTPPTPTPPKPPTPVAVQPPTPTPPPVHVKPIVQADAPPLTPDKPIVPKPVIPKVKVDLNLVDGPQAVADKPTPKKKKPLKKTVVKTHTDESTAPESDAPSTPDNTGLSKEQVAAQLGDKLKASGTEKAVKSGISGSDHTQTNPFASFYASLHDQVMDKWTIPNISDDSAVNPEVMIHVEKDGRVPPESVTLTRSSGNKAYDDSALLAARSIGYTLEPLPDGCPPDISITFKPTH